MGSTWIASEYRLSLAALREEQVVIPNEVAYTKQGEVADFGAEKNCAKSAQCDLVHLAKDASSNLKCE